MTTVEREGAAWKDTRAQHSRGLLPVDIRADVLPAASARDITQRDPAKPESVSSPTTLALSRRVTLYPYSRAGARRLCKPAQRAVFTVTPAPFLLTAAINCHREDSYDANVARFSASGLSSREGRLWSQSGEPTVAPPVNVVGCKQPRSRQRSAAELPAGRISAALVERIRRNQPWLLSADDKRRAASSNRKQVPAKAVFSGQRAGGRSRYTDTPRSTSDTKEPAYKARPSSRGRRTANPPATGTCRKGIGLSDRWTYMTRARTKAKPKRRRQRKETTFKQVVLSIDRENRIVTLGRPCVVHDWQTVLRCKRCSQVMDQL